MSYKDELRRGDGIALVQRAVNNIGFKPKGIAGGNQSCDFHVEYKLPGDGFVVTVIHDERDSLVGWKSQGQLDKDAILLFKILEKNDYELLFGIILK